MIVIGGLFLLGIGAVILELFIPAAGMVGILGAASLVGSIVMAFMNYGQIAGIGVLLAVLILTPIIIVVYFRHFPRSFFGKRIILGGDPSSKLNLDAPDRFDDLLGASGIVITALRPAGTVDVDGEPLSVVTSGEFIEPGERVKIVNIEGNRILVKKEM